MTFGADPNPAEPPALVAATQWIAGLLTGPLGTALGTVAVAWLGFAMLTGRIPLRQAGRVLLGLFILFGASAIARELTELALGGGQAGQTAIEPPPPAPPAQVPIPSPFDPYAGAAVPGG